MPNKYEEPVKHVLPDEKKNVSENHYTIWL